MMAAFDQELDSQPISYCEPTDSDREQSDLLATTLHDMNVFDDSNRIDKRQELIDFIHTVVKVWVSAVAEKQGKPPEHHGAKVVAFGGHQLGIIMKDSDIDGVCIVPNFVAREEFFTTFVTTLSAEAGTDLSQTRLVKGARVPIIAICLRGIEVDLCLARLGTDNIPEDFDININDVLKDMDITDIWSLNGTRETGRILDLVPNVDTFRSTLKAVKVWAKANGIHSCPMGYPGGIAWAVMVAKVCQLYPNAVPSTILVKFFTLFKDWNWPRPVVIAPQTKNDLYKLKPWNPQLNHEDSYHVMPIITPAYPEKNCAFSVTASALEVVRRQMRIASAAIDLVIKSEISWKSFFQPLKFFTLYKHFLMIIAQASIPSHHLDWSGLVNARTRVFVEDLERQESLALIHAYPKTYHHTECETRWFLGLEFTSTKGIKLRLAEDHQRFQKHLTELATKRGFYKPGMRVDVHHIRRKDLPTVLPSEEL